MNQCQTEAQEANLPRQLPHQHRRQTLLLGLLNDAQLMDATRHLRWATALVKTALEKPGNKKGLQGWIAKWEPLAETGFVHELVRRTFGDAMPDHEFYFAGPPPMTQGLQEMLMLGHRVPFGQIHFDRFF
ncbi:hypothetical protein ACVBEH_20020 [Roseateles sp. GG27B]